MRGQLPGGQDSTPGHVLHLTAGVHGSFCWAPTCWQLTERDLMCLTLSLSFPEHLSTNGICWLLTSFKKMKPQTAMTWVFIVWSKGVNEVLKYMRWQEPLWTSFKNLKPTQQILTLSMTVVKVYSQVDFLPHLCVSKLIFLNRSTILYHRQNF